MEDRQFVKKKTRYSGMRTDANTMTLIVDYNVEMTYKYDDGEKETDRTSHIERIQLNISERTDVGNLAGDIVRNCKLLNTTKTGQVEMLLRQLQLSMKEDQGRSAELANWDDLDDYCQQLYDYDKEPKIIGSWKILQLVKFPHQNDELMKKDNLMAVLSRTLSDEYKKNPELVSNLMNIFQLFSNFTSGHEVLESHKVKDKVLKILDFEIQRHKLRITEEKESGHSESKSKRRLKEAMKKQEKLMYVSFFGKKIDNFIIFIHV